MFEHFFLRLKYSPYYTPEIFGRVIAGVGNERVKNFSKESRTFPVCSFYSILLHRYRNHTLEEARIAIKIGGVN